MDSMDRRTFVSTLALLAVGSAGAKAAEVVGKAGSAVAGGKKANRQLAVPDWMEVDRGASRVTMDVTAGLTDENNYWNFNGYTNGEADIVVPEGFEVVLRFQNDDPNMAHSIGIDEVQSPWPAMLANPQPVFDGAISRDPTSMARATQPGQSEELTFTASEAGEYAAVCYIPGHAVIGMWTYFVVSADGEAGVRDRA